MKLTTLFEQLSRTVLSNLALSIEGGGAIREEKQQTVLDFTNESLLRLYSRFILKEKDVLIETVEHITNYHLRTRFTESNGDEEFLYIKDMAGEPFTEDVIKILAVYGSDTSYPLPLNDNERTDSLFTPQATVLQVPRVRTGASLSVLYQAKHPVLTLEDMDAEIELPDVLHSALRSHIAYQTYDSMNTDVSMAKAQSHYQAYEAICQDAIDKDLVATSISTTNSRFDKRGWK